MGIIQNPVEVCDQVFALIESLTSQIQKRLEDPKSAGAESSLLSKREMLWLFLFPIPACVGHLHLPAGGDDGHGCFVSSDLQLYHSETLELMLQRWRKLERDFRLKSRRYDISKIPDIYDCIKYDVQHNTALKLEGTMELFRLSKALADIVIPQVPSQVPLGLLALPSCGGAGWLWCLGLAPPPLSSPLTLAGVWHQQAREAGNRSRLLLATDQEDPARPAEDSRGRICQQAAPPVRFLGGGEALILLLLLP